MSTTGQQNNAHQMRSPVVHTIDHPLTPCKMGYTSITIIIIIITHVYTPLPVRSSPDWAHTCAQRRQEPGRSTALRQLAGLQPPHTHTHTYTHSVRLDYITNTHIMRHTYADSPAPRDPHGMDAASARGTGWTWPDCALIDAEWTAGTGLRGYLDISKGTPTAGIQSATQNSLHIHRGVRCTVQDKHAAESGQTLDL